MCISAPASFDSRSTTSPCSGIADSGQPTPQISDAFLGRRYLPGYARDMVVSWLTLCRLLAVARTSRAASTPRANQRRLSGRGHNSFWMYSAAAARSQAVVNAKDAHDLSAGVPPPATTAPPTAPEQFPGADQTGARRRHEWGHRIPCPLHGRSWMIYQSQAGVNTQSGEMSRKRYPGCRSMKCLSAPARVRPRRRLRSHVLHCTKEVAVPDSSLEHASCFVRQILHLLHEEESTRIAKSGQRNTFSRIIRLLARPLLSNLSGRSPT